MSTNPTGYMVTRLHIEANGEKTTLNADEIFYFQHDSTWLHVFD